MAVPALPGDYGEAILDWHLPLESTMLIHTPGILCDACGSFTEGTPNELLEDHGFTMDEYDNSFCGPCTQDMMDLAASTAAPEELAAMGEVIEEDPAVKALGPAAGKFLDPKTTITPMTPEQLEKAVRHAEQVVASVEAARKARGE